MLWLLPIGLLAVLGQLCMTRAYASGATLVVANLQYSGIVFAALFGLAVFGERLPWIGWAGMVVIIVSGIAAGLALALCAECASPRRLRRLVRHIQGGRKKARRVTNAASRP